MIFMQMQPSLFYLKSILIAHLQSSFYLIIYKRTQYIYLRPHMSNNSLFITTSPLQYLDSLYPKIYTSMSSVVFSWMKTRAILSPMNAETTICDGRPRKPPPNVLKTHKWGAGRCVEYSTHHTSACVYVCRTRLYVAVIVTVMLFSALMYQRVFTMCSRHNRLSENACFCCLSPHYCTFNLSRCQKR